MRVLGFIVVGCLVISGLQALVTALALVSVALLAFGIVVRPQTTLAALGLLACWSVVLAYPGVALGLLVLAFVRWWRDQPP